MFTTPPLEWIAECAAHEPSMSVGEALAVEPLAPIEPTEVTWGFRGVGTYLIYNCNYSPQGAPKWLDWLDWLDSRVFGLIGA